MIDTLGLNSLFDRLKHSILLRHSLTTYKLNTIFVILNFESRYDEMLREFNQIREKISNFDEKIVIMISKFDTCQNKEKAIKEIPELFENGVVKITLYFFHKTQI